MRPSKFTESEVLQALARVRAGAPAVEICRQLGITQTTFYRWRKQHDCGDLRDIRELREENQKLKEIVADLLLENQRLSSGRRRKY